jgi:S1-C subfamily serine protease
MLFKSHPVVRLPFVAGIAVALLVAAVTVVAAVSDEARQRAVESSVVKIFVHSNPPDVLSPWQKAGTETATGSGVIIDGNRILTNAHVVEDAVHIEVKRAGMSEQFVATADFIGHECDLALLTVADDRFFEDGMALQLGEMPNVQDEVQVYGFPIGGETISVTSGILSRIEVSTYLHSMEDLLIAQIDAPINSGNSGGPVVSARSVVGIALQSLKEGENVGYMIPATVIRHFLDDVADGHYDGFPRLGVDFQDLESEAQRLSLGMNQRQTGALVARVDHGSPADSFLLPGDVLLEIEGLSVANDGTVARPRLGRVYLVEVFQSKQMGESVSVSILRSGQSMQGNIELTPHQFLVPGRRTEQAPQYLVFAGFVFQPLTVNYLIYFEETPVDLGNHALIQNTVTPERSQIILIQKVLPHPVNRGYQDLEDCIVETVNGVVPKDMSHLAQIIDSAKGRWLNIVTEDRSYLTVDLSAARNAQDSILTSFGIARDRSPGLTNDAVTAQVTNQSD